MSPSTTASATSVGCSFEPLGTHLGLALCVAKPSESTPAVGHPGPLPVVTPLLHPVLEEPHLPETAGAATSNLPGKEESSGSLESFMQSLDTVNEEVELLRGVGVRRIDIIVHMNYEYRRDRASEAEKLSQRWVCRYAGKFKCKGKLRLKARDLINFAVGATVSDLQEHNHSPYRVNTFGLADITEVGSDHSSIRSTITDDTDASNHAISQLNEGDFSTDFGQGNMESRARSSPVASREYGTADISEAATPLTTADTSYSWDLVGVSQADAVGYQAVKHVKRRGNCQDSPISTVENSDPRHFDPDQDSSLHRHILVVYLSYA